MKKFTAFVLLMLMAAILPAAELTISNPFLKMLAKADGSVEITPAGAKKPYVVIRPDFNGGKVTPRQVTRKDCLILLLRSEDEKNSLTISMAKNSFAVSLNRTGKPVRIEWPAAAVILPDRASEDIVLTQNQEDTDIFLIFWVDLRLKTPKTRHSIILHHVLI